MSRLKNFSRNLVTSYLQLGVNAVYSLVSVPLALHYLDKPAFGLWVLVSQLGGYIALVDLGMNTSVARILIDHKDDRSNGVYGSVIKTGILVGIVQCFLIIGVGTVFSLFAGSLLNVSADLRDEFVWLMIGQTILSGMTFATRIFSQILYAHQRLDIGNYGSAVSFFLALGVMWLGFINGFGIYSFLISQMAMVLFAIVVSLTGCIRLKLLPGVGEWGQVRRERFNELFAFGQGVFLISVGSQFINTSQAILLTRLLGLEAAATWSVCTRVYTMLTMITWRIMDYSAPALSEMVVRREQDKLLQRIRDIAILMASLSLLCGTIFATANGAFVWVLTGGKMSWLAINNVLLGLWFVVCSIMRVHTGLVGITKNLRFLRFIFLIEGLVFIGLNLLAYHIESMTWMLIFSLICTMTFTLPYGLWRTRQYFKLRWLELLSWFHPTWQLSWRLIPVALVTWWLAQELPIFWQMILSIAVPGGWGIAVLLRYGLDSRLRSEIAEKLPSSVQFIIKRWVVL